MALIGTGDIIRFTAKGVADGQQIVNTYHYCALAPAFVLGDQGSGLVDALLAFRDKFRTVVLPILANTYTVADYDAMAFIGRRKPDPAVDRWVPIVSDIETLQGDTEDIGLSVGIPTPTFEAQGVTYRGQPRTWRARGGNRYGPVVEADSTNNTLILAARTELQGVANLMGGPLVIVLGGAELTRVIYTPTGLAKFPDPVVFPATFISPIKTAKANPFVTSQVSRKRRTESGS